MAASQGCCCHALLVRCQSKSILSDGKGNGNRQLRLDNIGTHPSAGGQLAVVTVKQFLSSMAMDSKFCDFRIRFFCDV